jgi:hypothetical protein
MIQTANSIITSLTFHSELSGCEQKSLMYMVEPTKFQCSSYRNGSMHVRLNCHTEYTPSRVPSSPIIIFIDVIICCATGGDIADA